MEGRGEEADNLMFSVDETAVGFAEDRLFLFGCGDIGEDAPGLGDEVDLAFDVVAAADRETVVEVGAEEPSTVPCGVLDGVDDPAAESGELFAVGEVGTGRELREVFHFRQEVGQEEGDPYTFALALYTYGAHAVVPVAAAH